MNRLWNLLQFLTIITILPTITYQQTQPKTNSTIHAPFPFQKILWTYWNSNTTEPPIIVQLCIDNMAKVAKKHNFTFILVNESNVRQYVQNYDELFVAVREKSIQRSFTHAADLLRMLIIEQNGGIWVDTTTIFLNGLTEIENIMSQQYEHMIANRFSPQPQAMFFYQANGQNRIQHTIPHPSNPQKSILYNEYPDLQIWSIFCRKNSSFISQIRKTYSQFTVTPFLLTQQRFVSEDIFINYIDNSRDYLYLNMAVTYALQRKQMQMDRQLTLFGQRKYVFEEYKVWGLHAEYGPMLTTREDLVPFDYLFWYSKQELKQMGFDYKFFMKQFGYIRKVTQEKFDVLFKYFDNNHMSFIDFLYNNISKETCQQVTFIVQGSIIDELLAGSEVYKKHRFVILTKSQNQEWLQHCGWKDTFWDKLQKKWKPYRETINLYKSFYYKVHKAKVRSILHQNQNLSLIQWIKITYEDNFFLIYEFCYMIMIAVIMFGSYVLVRWAVGRYAGGTIIFNELRENSNQGYKSYNRILCLTFALVVLNMFMYTAVELLGGRDQPVAIFFCVLVTFAIQAYIQQKLKVMKQANTLYYSIANSIYQLFFMAISYLSGFLCLIHVWRNRFWLNWFAQVLGMIGPCVLKLKYALDLKSGQQQSRRLNSESYSMQQTLAAKILYVIKANPHRIPILGFLLITLLLPNIRYIACDSGYYIKYISFVPLIYLTVIFFSTTIRCLYHKHYREIIRLIFLIIISTRLYLTINEIDTMVQKLPRVSFFAMNVVVVTLVYLQIGLQVEKNRFRIGVFGNLNLRVLEWLYGVLALVVEVVVGLVWFNHYKMDSGFVEYYLHYIFFLYNALITIMLSLFRTNQGQTNRNLSTEPQTIQLDTFEQEEYNQVNDQ